LPTRPGQRFRVLAGRALTRRCPYCGGRDIFAGYLSLREKCPHCRAVFEREEGYFLGAYAINLVAAEILGLGLVLYLLFATPLTRLSIDAKSILAGAVAVGLPILFFPFSRTLWMALDLFFDRSADGGAHHQRQPSVAEPRRPPG
jgi:uncharacterized protein (DUF983 family)